MSAEQKVSAFAVADGQGQYVLVKGKTLQIFVTRPAAEYQVKRMAAEEGKPGLVVKTIDGFDLVQAMYTADNVIIVDNLNRAKRYSMLQSQERLRAIKQLSRMTIKMLGPQLARMK